MNWINLQTEEELMSLKERSFKQPSIIFKHSTRCSISSMAKYRLDQSAQPENIDFYILDLLKHRSLSNKIADEFDVWHESPQVLIIKDGECIYDESHSGIKMDEIESQVKTN
jgi:bacillithiol system protein YtxJ